MISMVEKLVVIDNYWEFPIIIALIINEIITAQTLIAVLWGLFANRELILLALGVNNNNPITNNGRNTFSGIFTPFNDIKASTKQPIAKKFLKTNLSLWLPITQNLQKLIQTEL